LKVGMFLPQFAGCSRCWWRT